MCEGVFLFLQLFKLTTSSWLEHIVRAQRVQAEAERRPHEVRGTSAWTDRSGAENGPGGFEPLITKNAGTYGPALVSVPGFEPGTT